MRMRMVLKTVVWLMLTTTVTAATAHAKGILEILREKGILSEEEYRQAIEEAQEKEKKVEQELTEEVKKDIKVPKWLDRLSPFGDIRFRHEGFYNAQSSPSANPTRNRERLRARLGLGVNVSEELQGRLRLVTGDASDPISTNQTLTDLFTRKPINLDWAYITVSPWKTLGLDQLTGVTKPLFSITVGKFPLPLFAPGGSELVFDGDLSPEGITESAMWEQKSGLLRHVKIIGMQWMIKEFSNRNATDLFDPAEAWMFGGQAQVQLAPTANTRLTVALAGYTFERLDVIARERNTNSALQITNNVRLFNGTRAGGSPVSPSSCASPFIAPGCIAGFLGGFGILNASAQFDIFTHWKQWPLSVFIDFAHNLAAATNDANGYWGGVRIGRASNQGDFRLTYAYAYTETDAVLSALSYSDFGVSGGTNVMGHFISLDYVPLPHLTLTAKNHFVNVIDRPVGFHNPTVSRLQLDMVLSF